MRCRFLWFQNSKENKIHNIVYGTWMEATSIWLFWDTGFPYLGSWTPKSVRNSVSEAWIWNEDFLQGTRRPTRRPGWVGHGPTCSRRRWRPTPSPPGSGPPTPRGHSRLQPSTGLIRPAALPEHRAARTTHLWHKMNEFLLWVSGIPMC